MDVISRLTSKSQTTVPKAVRDVLDLRPGDTIRYEIDDGEVRIRKVLPADLASPRALQTTLGEWDSPEDAASYDDL